MKRERSFTADSPIGSYWLGHCTGFWLRGGRRSGVVEEIGLHPDGRVAALLVRRGGSARKRLVAVPVQWVDAIDPWDEDIVLMRRRARNGTSPSAPQLLPPTTVVAAATAHARVFDRPPLPPPSERTQEYPLPVQPAAAAPTAPEPAEEQEPRRRRRFGRRVEHEAQPEIAAAAAFAVVGAELAREKPELAEEGDWLISEPDPVASDPAPQADEIETVVEEPVASVPEPETVVEEPVAVQPDPEPELEEPELVAPIDEWPETEELEPVAEEHEAEPEPVADEPEPAAEEEHELELVPPVDEWPEPEEPEPVAEEDEVEPGEDYGIAAAAAVEPAEPAGPSPARRAASRTAVAAGAAAAAGRAGSKIGPAAHGVGLLVRRVLHTVAIGALLVFGWAVRGTQYAAAAIVRLARATRATAVATALWMRRKIPGARGGIASAGAGSAALVAEATHGLRRVAMLGTVAVKTGVAKAVALSQAAGLGRTPRAGGSPARVSGSSGANGTTRVTGNARTSAAQPAAATGAVAASATGKRAGGAMQAIGGLAVTAGAAAVRGLRRMFAPVGNAWERWRASRRWQEGRPEPLNAEHRPRRTEVLPPGVALRTTPLEQKTTVGGATTATRD